MINLNIMLVGVGGQGTLLASRILGNVGLQDNNDVKVSEVHGMSQRGGSVVTYVKIGAKIYSPLIEKYEADIIIAFEQLEAMRWIGYLRENGKMIINTQKIDPMPVITGKMNYPDNIIKQIKNIYSNTVAVDALGIAKECGNIKSVNMVLLGCMAASVNVDKSIWINSMRDIIPDKYIDVNIKAFEAGYSL
ncbi:MAG: indolepyruvate oxidoreductase subunit beta [Clostridia bacterium]